MQEFLILTFWGCRNCTAILFEFRCLQPVRTWRNNAVFPVLNKIQQPINALNELPKVVEGEE